MLNTVSTTMNAASAMMIQNVTCASSSNRHGFWPLPPDPHRDDQPGNRKGREHGGDNADAERDGEPANGTGADNEQHRSGNERGDVGIENGRQRPAEAGVDRRNRTAASA